MESYAFLFYLFAMANSNGTKVWSAPSIARKITNGEGKAAWIF